MSFVISQLSNAGATCAGAANNKSTLLTLQLMGISVMHTQSRPMQQWILLLMLQRRYRQAYLKQDHLAQIMRNQQLLN